MQATIVLLHVTHVDRTSDGVILRLDVPETRPFTPVGQILVNTSLRDIYIGSRGDVYAGTRTDVDDQ